MEFSVHLKCYACGALLDKTLGDLGGKVEIIDFAYPVEIPYRPTRYVQQLMVSSCSMATLLAPIMNTADAIICDGETWNLRNYRIYCPKCSCKGLADDNQWGVSHSFVVKNADK